MKIIEAMKRVKANKVKIADLQIKISQVSAHLSHETPVYGDETAEKIRSWAQSCEDLGYENIRLLTSISWTNLQTKVPIEIGGKNITKYISEWILRRGSKTNPGYAMSDMDTWSKMTDRGLKEGAVQSSTNVPTMIKIVRNYSPELRDEKKAEYQAEPSQIDAALEVVNAVTDLIER